MAETKIRTVRVPDALWDKALTRAREEGTSLSALIQEWLAEYTADEQPNTHEELRTIVGRLTRLAKRMRIDSNQQPIGM